MNWVNVAAAMREGDTVASQAVRPPNGLQTQKGYQSSERQAIRDEPSFEVCPTGHELGQRLGSLGSECCWPLVAKARLRHL